MEPRPELGPELARAAALAGLTRLVPVPFLDDLLLGRVRRGLVAGVLERHGRAAILPHLRPLWDDGSGCLAGACWFVVTLPVRLVLKLLKMLLRTVFFVLALRAAALTVSGTALLGRALERRLVEGGFPADAPPERLLAEAARFAAALRAATKGSDLRALQGGLSAALRGARGLARRPTVEAATTDPPAIEPEERRALDRLAGAIGQAFEGPEARAFLAEFDRRLEAEWLRQAAPTGGR